MTDITKYFQGENMPDVPDHTQLALAIGEMRGQVREMIHTQNNLLQQMQSMTAIVLKASTLPDTVATMDVRLIALEKVANQREGREGVIAAVSRSPALGWIVGAVTTLVLWLNGKLDI